MQYEEEKKSREAEKAAYLKKKEEEELKKIPYDEEFFSKGKGKKKKRQRNKNAAPSAAFILSVDSFEQFGSIGLNPPTKLEQVEGSVKELREKKEWYSKQPRGSVPTAKDIRKKNE